MSISVISMEIFRYSYENSNKSTAPITMQSLRTVSKCCHAFLKVFLKSPCSSMAVWFLSMWTTSQKSYRTFFTKTFPSRTGKKQTQKKKWFPAHIQSNFPSSRAGEKNKSQIFYSEVFFYCLVDINPALNQALEDLIGLDRRATECVC